MNYLTQDVQFQLPETECHDLSINILKLPALAATLVVTRAPLEAATLEESFDQQIQKLERQVKNFRFHSREALMIGQPAQVPALEIRNEFVRGPEKVFQYQLACTLPGTRTMLALSYVKASPLTAADSEHWQAIKASVLLGQPAAS